MSTLAVMTRPLRSLVPGAPFACAQTAALTSVNSRASQSRPFGEARGLKLREVAQLIRIQNRQPLMALAPFDQAVLAHLLQRSVYVHYAQAGRIGQQFLCEREIETPADREPDTRE